MLYFKSGCVSFNKCIDFLNGKDKAGYYWGFMIRKRESKELISQKGFSTFDDMLSLLLKIDSKKELNNYQIAFYQGKCADTRDCMPLFVVKDMCEISHIQKIIGNNNDGLKFEKVKGDNIIMLNPLKEANIMYEFNTKYTAEKDYIYNIIAAFRDDVLENTIQFFGKFGVFDNADFIMLNRQTGFKFVGKYRTVSGGINNGEIVKSKSMVWCET